MCHTSTNLCSSSGNFQPSREMMLKFYGFYKQATCGPCTDLKPAFWDVIGKAKWYENDDFPIYANANTIRNKMLLNNYCTFKECFQYRIYATHCKRKHILNHGILRKDYQNTLHHCLLKGFADAVCQLKWSCQCITGLHLVFFISIHREIGFMLGIIMQ